MHQQLTAQKVVETWAGKKYWPWHIGENSKAGAAGLQILWFLWSA
jgi:hypothetical protein